jgi:hypothetical protein
LLEKWSGGMGAFIHSDKHLILNNRYALLGCIAVSAAGKVYRGRDLEQVKHQGLESRVLIHVLPAASAAWSLDAMFQQMTSTSQQIQAPWVLPALAYGQDDGVAYVVLASPDTWELQSLLSQAEIPQQCYRSTRHHIDPLVKQGHLDAHIDPALLLCAGKESLYLLATAFAIPIRALEKRVTHHPLMPRKHVGQALMTGTLLMLFGVFTAVAGNAVLEFHAAPTPNVAVNMPTAPAATLQLASLPSTAVTTVAMTQLDQSLPTMPKVALISTTFEPEQKAEKKTEKKAVAVSKPKLMQASLPKPKPDIAPEPLPVAQPQQTSRAYAEPLPAEAPARSIDTLIGQAYTALHAGNLGANDGALYFTRQLRGQAAQHPQVTRLGQEITATHLRQIRVALQTNRRTAAQLLPMTRQLIEEFGLDNLLPAQQVLEDKTAELGAF